MAKLATRWRNSGESELERWAAKPHGLLGILMFVTWPAAVYIFIGRDWQPWQVSVWFGLMFGITLLYDDAAKKSACAPNPFVANWRPKLEQHFRENLHEHGLMRSILSGELSPELKVALSPEYWPERERPIESLWWKTNLTTPKRRVLGLLKHYVRCCRALALAPFPAGFMQRTLPAQLWFWLNGDMWPAVLRVVLAETLVSTDAETGAG